MASDRMFASGHEVGSQSYFLNESMTNCSECSNPFGRDDAIDAGEVFGHTNVRPGGGVKEGLYSRQTLVAEFQHKQSALLQLSGSLKDQLAIKFIAFRATIQCLGWLMVVDFHRERLCFLQADVGRVTDDEVKGERRQCLQQV